jgi:hypothetical protein
MIIERVLSFGNLQEFLYILEMYSSQTLEDEIIKLGYPDPKTMSFVAGFLISAKKASNATQGSSHRKHTGVNQMSSCSSGSGTFHSGRWNRIITLVRAQNLH